MANVVVIGVSQCHNPESSRPKIGHMRVHEGGGQPYLAQGSSMQQNLHNLVLHVPAPLRRDAVANARLGPA